MSDPSVSDQPLTVREVARLARVTVRTLHHYDEIGLLEPAGRTESGYRLYGPDQLIRLHAILLWRTLGFPLDEIRSLVDESDHDVLESLQIHRERLIEKLGALNERIAAVDRAIERQRRGEPLEEVDLRAIFDGFDPVDHADEAATRWGDTPAWSESRRRTRRYGEREWRRIDTERRAVEARLAELLGDGVPADAPEARVAAEAHRSHISRWFYDCTAEIHLGLAELYESDLQFRAHYDATADGLADYLVAAIRSLHRPTRRAL